MRILAPSGFLGYGFPQDSFERGLCQGPDFIGVDSGSTDPGPYYLGSGESLAKRAQLKRDLGIVLLGARSLGVPLLIGSAATAGGEPHLAFLLDILYEIAREEGLHFTLAVIHAEIAKEQVQEALGAGRIRSLPGLDLALRAEDTENAVRIVGQMGVGPYIQALGQGADVIVAGRSCDTSIFAAIPISRGFEPGLSYHLAKILECGALAATPGSASDCMLGTLRKEHFTVRPLNPRRRCTEASVAAHGLYEQADPFRIYEPEGIVDLSRTVFRQLDEHTVHVSGTRFIEDEISPTIKLEGVELVGYRTVALAGVRDRQVIEHLEDIELGVKREMSHYLPAEILEEGYSIRFICYGRDGVLGKSEPERSIAPREVGVVIEAIASSQENADAVCACARSGALHFGFEGRKSTAGNLAFPFSPSDIKVGPVFKFSVYHLLEVDDPSSLFAVELQRI